MGMALAWAASPRLLLRYTLLGMFNSIMPPISVYLGAQLVNKIANSRLHPTSLSDILPIIIGLWITIIVQRPGQIAYEEAKTSSQSGTGIDPPYPAIAGLGDNAFSQRDAVFVLQGDVYLIIQAQNPNADFVAVAQQLAHQALLHL